MLGKGLYPTILNGIEIGGVYIHEPGGMISNILVVITCIIFASRMDIDQGDYVRYWQKFLLCIAVGSFGGIFIHGVPTVLGETTFYFVWAIKNSFVPLANYFALRGLLSIVPVGNLNRWKQVLVLKGCIAIIGLWLVYSFLPAVIDLALTYIIIVIITSKYSQLKVLRTLRNAFLVALFSGPLYLMKYDIDPLWFSHKDMVHVFVLISLYLIFKSTQEFSEGLESLEAHPEVA